MKTMFFFLFGSSRLAKRVCYLETNRKHYTRKKSHEECGLVCVFCRTTMPTSNSCWFVISSNLIFSRRRSQTNESSIETDFLSCQNLLSNVDIGIFSISDLNDAQRRPKIGIFLANSFDEFFRVFSNFSVGKKRNSVSFGKMGIFYLAICFPSIVFVSIVDIFLKIDRKKEKKSIRRKEEK